MDFWNYRKGSIRYKIQCCLGSNIKELGGRSIESGKKSCPKNGARILYEFGRIINKGIPYQDINLLDVWNNHSKNGVYSLIAIDVLAQFPDIKINKLRQIVKDCVSTKFCNTPNSDQGAVKVAYIMWKLRHIR